MKKEQNKIPYEIDPRGSLGLLSLGDVGVIAWRKAREEEQKKEKRNGEKT